MVDDIKEQSFSSNDKKIKDLERKNSQMRHLSENYSIISNEFKSCLSNFDDEKENENDHLFDSEVEGIVPNEDDEDIRLM